MVEIVNKIESEASKQNVSKKAPIFVPTSNNFKNREEDLNLPENPADLYGTKEAIELINKPVWFTESDKKFIDTYRNKTEGKNIQREKMKFTANTIELNGLKFPRTIVKYQDVQDVSSLSASWRFWVNVFQSGKYDYFSFDAVEELVNAGYRIPSTTQWKQAADVFGWGWAGYYRLGKLLHYPKVGFHSANGQSADFWSVLWSSTSKDETHAYSVTFDENYNSTQNWNNKYNFCSLVFLQ